MMIVTGNAELFNNEDAMRLLGCLLGSVWLHRGFACERHVQHREEALSKLSGFRALSLLVSKATQAYQAGRQPVASRGSAGKVS